MLVAQLPPQVETEGQRRSRRRLVQLQRDIHSRASQAAHVQRQADEAQERLQQLERLHPEMVQIDTRQSLGRWILVLGVLAVYLLDFLLLRAVAEYFAQTAFAGSPQMVAVACILVPVLIVVIELNIDIQRYFAHEDADEMGPPHPYWFWTVLAVVFAVGIPALVVATHRATQLLLDAPELEGIFRWQLLGIVVFALGAHALVLFGGRIAHDARSYAVFKTQQGRLCRQLRRFNRYHAEDVQASTEAYGTYWHQLQAYNANYPHAQMAPGPFDSTARELLRERLGYEVIQTPDVDLGEGNEQPSVAPPDASASRPPQQPQAEPSPHENDAGDGEDSYLRTILSRRMRDEESEVRP